MTLESDYLEKGLDDWDSTLISEVSGALLTVRENRRERIIFSPGRTHNRNRSLRWEASGR